VARAAAVVIAVAFREDERIEVGRPIALEGSDDVEVREQHERLPRARAVIANDDVAFVRSRTTLEDIARRKTGSEKTLGDSVRGRGRVPDRVRRVDLDELFADVARQLLVRRERLSRKDGGKENGYKADNGRTHQAAPG